MPTEEDRRSPARRAGARTIPDAFTYFLYLFDGRSITPTFSYNEPLVGLTRRAGAEDRDRLLPADGVPSVDADIDACVAIADATSG